MEEDHFIQIATINQCLNDCAERSTIAKVNWMSASDTYNVQSARYKYNIQCFCHLCKLYLSKCLPNWLKIYYHKYMTFSSECEIFSNSCTFSNRSKNQAVSIYNMYRYFRKISTSYYKHRLKDLSASSWRQQVGNYYRYILLERVYFFNHYNTYTGKNLKMAATWFGK